MPTAIPPTAAQHMRNTMPEDGADADAMEGPDNGDRGKRQRDDDAEELTGYARALDVLQRMLPELRPGKKGSVEMAVATEVLMEQWLLSAWHRDSSKFENGKKPELREDITKQKRRSIRKAVGDEAWLLVADASVDEVPELVDCAILLSSPEGRAQLVARHDARMERQGDGGFEPWPHAADEDAHASLRECKLKEKAEVMLTGRGELTAAGIAGNLNGQIGSVVSFSEVSLAFPCPSPVAEICRIASMPCRIASNVDTVASSVANCSQLYRARRLRLMDAACCSV